MGFKMSTYIGTKTIRAITMTKGAYNLLRGWELSRNDDAAEVGYLVEYTDGGKPNVEGFKGYVSWSPKDVFERSYKVADSFIDRLKIERDELKDKLEKLSDFHNSAAWESISSSQKDLLIVQLGHMTGYEAVLSMRLLDLEGY